MIYILKAIKKYRTSPILNIQKKVSSSAHSDRQFLTVSELYSHQRADSKASIVKSTGKDKQSILEKHHSDRNVPLTVATISSRIH